MRFAGTSFAGTGFAFFFFFFVRLGDGALRAGAFAATIS
jgi:hypothetical protein